MTTSILTAVLCGIGFFLYRNNKNNQLINVLKQRVTDEFLNSEISKNIGLNKAEEEKRKNLTENETKDETKIKEENAKIIADYFNNHNTD